MLMALKMEEGAMRKECRQPLEAGGGKAADVLWSPQKECSPADLL